MFSKPWNSVKKFLLVGACLTTLLAPYEAEAAPKNRNRAERLVKKAKKKRKTVTTKKTKYTPTLEENLTPAQIDRKIAIFRSRIVNASEFDIPSEYEFKAYLLEAFDDLAKTQIGRYLFEKAHPDILFEVRSAYSSANYSLFSKRIGFSKSPFRNLPLELPASLAHEVMHSVQDINGMISVPGKSIPEGATLFKLMEMNSALVEILVQDQMGKLPKYRHLPIDPRVAFFRELRDAKKAEGADEETAERFARTKVVETYWGNYFDRPIHVGDKTISPRRIKNVVSEWNAAYNLPIGRGLDRDYKRDAMQDRGIIPHIQKYIQMMGVDMHPSFFRDPKTTSFSIPNSTTMITYSNGIKNSEIQGLVDVGVMMKWYRSNGQLFRFNIQVKEKKGADGNRSYTEYHDDQQTRRATYTYRNGKMNGVYREYDQQGNQILEVPVKNNSANGNGWVMENGKRVLKNFKNGAVRGRTRE